MMTGDGSRRRNSTDWSRFGAPASSFGASSISASAASLRRMVISSPAAPSTMSNSIAAAVFSPSRAARRRYSLCAQARLCPSDAEPIGLDGVAAEELALIGRRKACGRPVERGELLQIAAGELAQGRVPAVENAVRAKAVDNVIDVRPELVRRPALVIGLGGDAGELAHDIGQRRHLADVAAPRFYEAGLDPGLADVIEDESDLRTPPHHGQRVRHLRMEDADVEGEIVFRQ